MPYTLINLLVLGIIHEVKCELSLQIIKNVDDFYTPVSSIVEEKTGTNFSLLCELVSSKSDNKHFDDQISWARESPEVNFRNESDLEDLAQDQYKLLQGYLRPSDVNKGTLRFYPLRHQDEGRYFCMSLKHRLFRIVRVFVKNDVRKKITRYDTVPFSPVCDEMMFKCTTHLGCISKHYLCDGKADCGDGSDEEWELCDGDPCKGKLQCDGRCIPLAWCCDRHHDLNCTVTNRPKCCQVLSEPYEELEYNYVPYNVHSVKDGSSKYLFISVCVLSTFFSIVLLLMILSKIVIFAKKSAYVQARNNHFEEFSLRHRTERHNFPYSYRECPRENFDISNPLLVACGSNTNPPAYSEVVASSFINVNDPPPPYTSMEVLNVGSLNRNA